jgi:hypothetical protein
MSAPPQLISGEDITNIMRGERALKINLYLAAKNKKQASDELARKRELVLFEKHFAWLQNSASESLASAMV